MWFITFTYNFLLISTLQCWWSDKTDKDMEGPRRKEVAPLAGRFPHTQVAQACKKVVTGCSCCLTQAHCCHASSFILPRDVLSRLCVVFARECGRSWKYRQVIRMSATVRGQGWGFGWREWWEGRFCELAQIPSVKACKCYLLSSQTPPRAVNSTKNTGTGRPSTFFIWLTDVFSWMLSSLNSIFTFQHEISHEDSPLPASLKKAEDLARQGSCSLRATSCQNDHSHHSVSIFFWLPKSPPRSLPPPKYGPLRSSTSLRSFWIENLFTGIYTKNHIFIQKHFNPICW